jgi:hypothetical protein
LVGLLSTFIKTDKAGRMPNQETKNVALLRGAVRKVADRVPLSKEETAIVTFVLKKTSLSSVKELEGLMALADALADDTTTPGSA